MNILEVVSTIFIVLILAETTYLTVKKIRQRKLKVARGSLILDTSALMDGRIVDVAKTGIITAEIIIPNSVVSELQLLADKGDQQKRGRARQGLENIKLLQKNSIVTTTIVNDGDLDPGGVDRRLLDLANKYDASIATTDYNLNKVAKVSDIPVVNVNELAQMMRAQLLPGDRVEIKVIQEGQNRNQGVGYLEDGTMVVVDHAQKNIGAKINVEITRSFQTEAGRMMFAKKVK